MSRFTAGAEDRVWSSPIALWCNLVHIGSAGAYLVQMADTKRFTVTIERADYDALCELGARHRPPLRLQYLVSLAVRRLLDETGDGQLMLHLVNPDQRVR
jgi:hypothetical protein